MAYEYNPESSRFEIANPHRVENVFLGIAAAACFGCAVEVLLLGQAAVGMHQPGMLVRALLVAVTLLGSAISFGVAGLSQLRFFFGRHQPADLASQPEEAARLRDMLRANAISYATPKGPLDHLLYSLAPDLVFAPSLTQILARTQFRLLVALAFLLVCFSGAVLLASDAGTRDGVSVLYFSIAMVQIAVPVVRARFNLRRAAFDVGGLLSTPAIIAMIVVAFIAPVLLPLWLRAGADPLAAYIQLPVVTGIILVAAVCATLLVLVATLAQQIKPNRIAIAQSLQTVSMNAPPSQIFLEFDREMQRDWVEQIPNRRYLNRQPECPATNGTFNGEALQETQPIPQDAQALTFARCVASPTYRWLLAADGFAALAAICGALMMVDYARSVNHFGAEAMGICLLAISWFVFANGNTIWRRFEFTSRIYWLECQGGYQRARSTVGALLEDRVKTEKDLINVEDMTLRLWVAEIDSVSFGVDQPRSLTSIRGRFDEAERLCAHLAQFARGQATVVVPSSETDMQRLAVLQKVNAAATPSRLQAASPEASTPAVSAANPSSLPAAKFCSQCGHGVSAEAKFCSHCGAMVG